VRCAEFKDGFGLLAPHSYVEVQNKKIGFKILLSLVRTNSTSKIKNILREKKKIILMSNPREDWTFGKIHTKMDKNK